MLLFFACTDEAPDGDGDKTLTERSWDDPFTWSPTTPLPCPTTVPDDDLVGQAFGAVGVGWDVGIPASRFATFGAYVEDDPARRSWYHPLMEDITALPCTGGNVVRRATDALSSDHPLTTLVADAAWMLDAPLTVGGTVSESTLDDVLTEIGGEADTSAVPSEIAALAASLLSAAIQAHDERDDALELVDESAKLASAYARFPNTYLPSTEDGLEPADGDDLTLLAPANEALPTLYGGATRITKIIDERVLSTPSSSNVFSVRIETDLGLVLLSGGGDDVYDPSEDESLDVPILLVLDAGGDDTWRIPAGATSDEDHGVAIHVDLGGDDLYGYPEEGSPHDLDGLLVADADGRYAGDDSYGPLSKSQVLRQGAASLGYGILVDLGGGADQYQTLRFGQGYGALGVGLLYDDAGDDTYVAEASAQAVGLAGIGLLVDGDGADRYRAFTHAQGFAYPQGAGLLVEGAGNDAFELVVDELLMYPWYDGWPTNVSLGQGTGYGSRDSSDTDAVQLAGGLGVLADAAGDDVYEAAVMAQGHGYWMGFGVLGDDAGNDRYDGMNYVQGAAEHFGLGVFLDAEGDDTYQDTLTPTHSSLGLGHDYSIGVFVDGGGNDSYLGPDRGIGAGKCHGLGLFVDRSGNDRYEALNDRAIGWATDWDYAVDSCGESTDIATWGFFVDGGGTDIYVKPDNTGYGDDQIWVTDDPSDTDSPLELSAGIDGDGDSFATALR